MRKSCTLYWGLLAALLPLAAGGAPPAPRPVVVELFTSQGCYSCPPAERLLGELIRKRPELIALEFHVDYWNDLVYGFAGSWQDVHSRPEYTARQQAYAQSALRGRSGVYTPQMVIGGVYAAVGSNSDEVERRIAQLQQTPAPLGVSAALREGALRVRIEGARPGGVAVWLARYALQRSTTITSGENKGKTLQNHHVVTALRKIGSWREGSEPLTVAGLVLGADEGCAVFVQDEELGEILGAARCEPAPA